MIFRDKTLEPLWRKINDRQRLSLDDGRALFASPDLLGVGWMADRVRRQRHGNRATFVVNRQINPTNICLLSCKFCDYASKEGWDNAYVLSEKEILDRLSPDLREVHIVGGLYRKWSFDDYLNVLRIVRRAYPHIQLKAYTAVEIDYFSRIEKIPLRQVLERLKAEGLVALPGGGEPGERRRGASALGPKFRFPPGRQGRLRRQQQRDGAGQNFTPGAVAIHRRSSPCVITQE